MNPTILIFADSYLPGYRAGGPIRSIANLARNVSSEMNVRIVTRDHDLGEETPFSGIMSDQWNDMTGTSVLYLSRKGQSVSRICRLLRDGPCDVIYLNSFFSRPFSILPFALWRVGLIPRKPIVLSPRGELSNGALSLNRRAKKLYLHAAKRLSWYDDPRVIWNASTKYEADDIQRALGVGGRSVNTFVAGDITLSPTKSSIRTPKRAGEIAIAFVGRVSRMKNLDFALRSLAEVRGKINLSLYGPKEDASYWHKCQTLIDTLPPSITVVVHGHIPHEMVLEAFTKHDILLLPTLGENYGHVICEALVAGCPVVISDRTPWRGLQDSGVGWDLSLSDIGSFITALQKCVDMGPEEFAAFSDRAQVYGATRADNPKTIELNLQLFRHALALGSRS